MKIILSTTPNIDKAKTIAKALVETKLAACINIVPKVISIYEWENAIQNDEEAMMIIKTSDEMAEKAKNKILELHAYTLPEVIFIDINDGNKDYIDWVSNQVQK
ncbi:MAG: divalent-cation tolerance protein CutA [bacterium]